ncbi:MAG: ABC transporter ATP-binding protein [Elusimicrobiota bacterium]
MPEGYSLEIAGVRKSFAGVPILQDVHLKLRKGEFFALLGPSGCGKTTLLRIIAGLETPDAGTIMLSGRDVAGVPPDERPVNTVFQHYALFPHLKVADNVAFGLRMKQVPEPEIASRVQEALASVQLADLKNRYPAQLSGGQQQRVALARALVNRPELLLLDEPMAALDEKLREDMREELKALQHRTGIGFLYITHDQEEALELADRIAVMDKGRVLQVGPPRDIYEEPASAFVADFIGDTNLVPGEVADVEKLLLGADLPGRRRTWVKVDGLDRIEALTERALSPRQKVSVSLRPERLHVSTRRITDFHNCVSGKVEGVLFLGSDIEYQVRLPSGLLLRARAVYMPVHRILKNGETAYLHWRAEDSCLVP